jgi:hypothetical protein
MREMLKARGRRALEGEFIAAEKEWGRESGKIDAGMMCWQRSGHENFRWISKAKRESKTTYKQSSTRKLSSPSSLLHHLILRLQNDFSPELSNLLPLRLTPHSTSNRVHLPLTYQLTCTTQQGQSPQLHHILMLALLTIPLT